LEQDKKILSTEKDEAQSTQRREKSHFFYESRKNGYSAAKCGKRKYFMNDLITEKIIGSAIEVHEAQLLTYLRLLNRPNGLLLNFNAPVLKAGIKRISL